MVYKRILNLLLDGNVDQDRIPSGIDAPITCHECLLDVARELWKRPYLVYHKVPVVEQQKNRNVLESVVRTSVDVTLQRCMPLKQAYQRYLSNVFKGDTPAGEATEFDRDDNAVEGCLFIDDHDDTQAPERFAPTHDNENDNDALPVADEGGLFTDENDNDALLVADEGCLFVDNDNVVSKAQDASSTDDHHVIYIDSVEAPETTTETETTKQPETIKEPDSITENQVCSDDEPDYLADDTDTIVSSLKLQLKDEFSLLYATLKQQLLQELSGSISGGSVCNSVEGWHGSDA
jgi:hypothetical protein